VVSAGEPTQTSSASGLFQPGEPIPGLLLAWAPTGVSHTDRARVTEELRVGRGEGADWAVDDDRISSLHFRVRRFGGTLLVQDARSRNGTFVDGQPLQEPRAVGWGAVIRAGRCVFVTHADLGELDAPSPPSREIIGPFFAPRMLRDLEVASRTGRHVLLVGPTGTGKELCARWLSARIAPSGPFVAHNCARSSSAEEAASTLFGVARAVFSGVDPRPGLIEEGDGGVLFLDEVNTLPRRVQQSLLRFAEDGRHARIGATTGKTLQVRLVFATNEPLAPGGDVEGLAPDLLARLRLVSIPPLSERRADVPAIFLHALAGAAAAAGVDAAPFVAELGADHFEALCLEDWTGRNVRGLASLATEMIAAADTASPESPATAVRSVLAARLRPAARARVAADASSSLYERNRERIVAAWQASGGNLTRTEQALRTEGLAVNRRWLAEFLRRWGLRA
jgi:DNA-binding NtrC family response regulator